MQGDRESERVSVDWTRWRMAKVKIPRWVYTSLQCLVGWQLLLLLLALVCLGAWSDASSGLYYLCSLSAPGLRKSVHFPPHVPPEGVSGS